MLNLNKLFPRLTIRAKLAIAFASLALVPLGVVAAFATRVTVEHLRVIAKASLEHDLEASRAQVQAALQDAEEDVAYLAHAVFEPALARAGEDPGPQAARLASAFLAFKPVLYQVKLVGADGDLLLLARAGSGGEAGAQDPDRGDIAGLYYAYRAERLKAGDRLLLPVELRAEVGGSREANPVAAVAILVPIRDAGGSLLGVVVGEAYASVLFSGLEVGSPHLAGETGLVDSSGFFLYHSARKRDWASLLASRAQLDLRTDFSPDLASEIVSGRAGTLPAAANRIVSFAPLSLGRSGTGPLVLFRVVPLSATEAPVRSFLRWVAGGAVLAVTLVLGLAVLAANQLTRPIYRLREGARRLALGEPPQPLQIETNDELEDLAGDFSAMATALSAHRRKLEELVAERTRALRETYAELANVLDHSADAILGLDPDGHIRVWNRGAESLFGHTAAEALGRDADKLLLPRSPHAEREAAHYRRQLAERGAVVNFPTRRVRKGGEPIAVTVTETLMRDESGGPLGNSLIIRDARLQAKLEEQMRRSERLAAASVVAAALAHELNNPLAILGNRIECMARDIRDRCAACFLEDDLAVLREHTARLGHVTGDLLRFASDDRDQFGPVALDQVAARMVRLVDGTFVARGVRLELVSGHDLPPVLGSEKGLETVCMNLLLNAADATPAGGAVTVRVGLSPASDAVELEVQDSGQGVPPDLGERIFEPFFTTKGPRGGTGLGLTVCRNIVERHAGRIRVESEEGRGARFIVRLPLGPRELA
ncbi:MAG: PAS domain S-box protein [Gemmatimonadetes bacterium]|nr:PAS domain S-box protein [Gemmatimonadota bacterium]